MASGTYRVNRKRSAIDDMLLLDLCKLAMQPYVSVRKSAQRGLNDACKPGNFAFIP
jgi:hypothetical protein